MKVFTLIYQVSGFPDRYFGLNVLTVDHQIALKGLIMRLLHEEEELWFVKRHVWAVPFERMQKYEYN